MKKASKTITLWAGDQPHVTIHKGHIGAVVFNKAHKAEGWHGDWVFRDNLNHEFWKPIKNGGWRKSKQTDPKAKPVTAMYW